MFYYHPKESALKRRRPRKLHTACLIGSLAVKNILAALGTEVEEEEDSNKVQAVSFYPRTDPVKPLEWKALENRLKPSSTEPPKPELKELPKHLEYAFLQENNQFQVAISSVLSTVEKAKLLEVLRNHKGAIAWSIADTKGIDLSFCTHKILNEDKLKPSVQPQRRVNPNIKEVVKKEIINLLDVGLIYPIFDSPWVSPVQVVPKKGGMAVVKNEKNELIPQMTVTGWRRCVTDIFHELIEDGMEVFMEDFSVFDFSHVARPTTQLLVKDALFNFSKECIQAFEKLNCELTHAPIMIKPDWSLPFEVMYDASDYAVGVVLGQRIDMHFKPIHYVSKIINEARENYTTTEKEILAVVFAFDKWILLLQEFDIKIRNKKGAKNLVADHLSWLENPDLGKLTKAKIRDLFAEERLMAVSDKNNKPW
nr:hypothetical protein [Tanacetum cinerariifolium]